MKWPGKIMVCAALLISAVVGYAWMIEPQMIRITRLGLPDELKVLASDRLVFVADLHVTRHWRKADQLVKLIAGLDPDYLLWGGDLVAYEGEVEDSLAVIRRVRGKKGTFAVLGDSEYMGRLRNCVFCHVPGQRTLRNDLPVRFLRNEAVELEQGVRLVGLDPESRGAWAATAQKYLAGAGPAIVLSHKTTALLEMAVYRPALILAGDTHGGQIWMPYTLRRLAFGRKAAIYNYGWFEAAHTKMFVTRGVGESRVPARLGCPPEVVLFEGRP